MKRENNEHTGATNTSLCQSQHVQRSVYTTSIYNIVFFFFYCNYEYDSMLAKKTTKKCRKTTLSAATLSNDRK